MGVGNRAIIDAGLIDAVDVYGWVLPNTQVCFRASSGSLRFLDAATAPRRVLELAAWRVNGMTCARISGAGTVVLIKGPPLHSRHKRRRSHKRRRRRQIRA